MNAIEIRAWIAGLAVFVATTTAPVAFANPDDSQNNNGEVLVVEPLNVTFLQGTERTTGIGFGFEVNLAVNPVPYDLDQDPSTPKVLVYEFSVLYGTYPNGPTSPKTFEAVGPNPMQGTISVNILPVAGLQPTVLTDSLILPPYGKWNGTSRKSVFIDPTFDADLSTPTRSAAIVRVPAEFVQNHPALNTVASSSGVVGLIRANHQMPGFNDQATGFFQVAKRNFFGNQLTAQALDATPTPVLFLNQSGSAGSQVVVVEPLNSEIISTDSPVNVGVQNIFVAEPVLVAAEICGGDAGDRTPTECYEFAAMYASYTQTGQQILHLPNPDPNDPLQAPITGDLDVEIIPVNNQAPLTRFQIPFGRWDGVSTNSGKVYIYTLRNGLVDAVSTYELATIRIPAARVEEALPSAADGVPGGAIGLIRVSHVEPSKNTTEIGFFSPFKRNMVFNQDLANMGDAMATPVFFRTEQEDHDTTEVILVEPMNLIEVGVPGVLGANILAAQAITNIHGEQVYEFGITYGTYPGGGVRVHQVGVSETPSHPRDLGFPIAGDLEVRILSNTPGDPAVIQEWDGSSSGKMWIDFQNDSSIAAGQFRVAKVQIPKEVVLGSLSVIPGAPFAAGLIAGVHTLDGQVASGFFNLVKRQVAYSRELADPLDSAPMPVYFVP